MHAEHNLPAVYKATMEEAAIVGRPSVANLLEVSRELPDRRKLWEHASVNRESFKLPDRGLAMDIWPKSFGQLEVDR